MLELFTSALVTFFVAIDPPGVAPIFAALTEDTPKAYRRKMAIKSVLIASGVLLAFALGGAWLLNAMHISLDAFRVAGGVLLFLMALEMIFEKRTERREKRAEELIRMSHQRKREEDDPTSRIFDDATGVIAISGEPDTPGVILSANDAVCDLLGRLRGDRGCGGKVSPPAAERGHGCLFHHARCVEHANCVEDGICRETKSLRV